MTEIKFRGGWSMTVPEQLMTFAPKGITAPADGAGLVSLGCWMPFTQPPSPIVHGKASPAGSQSLRNSSRSKPRTWPIIPARSFVRCSIRISRSLGFREVPSPNRADLPAKDLISDPSATISDTHLSSLMSMSTKSICCCLVILA